LQRMTSGGPMVLAIAGGIVDHPETYSMLLESFQTVWLKARPEEHMERVRAQGDERPMAGNPQAMGELRALLNAREPEYARAALTVDTAGRSVRESLDDVLAAIARGV
ncbi:MAG: shikimate kinase, partial [Pseudomonadota bacterium]